jgi:hypothetical protein
MYFASQTEQGFYTPDIHGPRTIFIVDPAWVRPTKNIVLAPGESYDDYANDVHLINETDYSMTVTVPDPDAVPRTIEEPNPSTKIPADAVEITDEQWLTLINGPGNGKVVDWSVVPPVLIDPPVTPLTAEQVEAQRLRAYADPFTGSDRYFAEAARLNTQGATEEAATVTAAGLARYEEIRAVYPWPEESPTRKTKAKK